MAKIPSQPERAHPSACLWRGWTGGTVGHAGLRVQLLDLKITNLIGWEIAQQVKDAPSTAYTHTETPKINK